MDALEASFASHPMHAYFNPAANNTSLVFNRLKGRHVVAAKPIPAGTAVFTMEPYAAVVKDAFVPQICIACFRAAATMFCCSKCQHARFCSKKCQNAGGSVHTLECAAIKRLQETKFEGETAALRLVIRIAFLQQQERILAKQKEEKDEDPTVVALKKKAAASNESEKTKLVWKPKPGQSWADAASLITHSDRYTDSAKAEMKLLLNRIQQNVIADEEIWRAMSLDQTLDLLLAIQCNAHHIADDSKNAVGLGLFIPAAYLNHSCKPNCAWWFDEQGRMVMQSLRRIAANEEITYSYIDVYNSRSERHQMLQKVFMVDVCQCDKCTRTTESKSEDAFVRMMICGSCGTNPMLDSKPATAAGSSAGVPISKAWPILKLDKLNNGDMFCPGCSRKYTHDELESLLRGQHRLCQRGMLMSQSGDFADAIECIEEKVLYPTRRGAEAEGKTALPWPHPYHAGLFNAYLLLSSIADGAPKTAVSLEDRLRYVSYALECLAAQSLMNHPEAGKILLMRGQILAAMHRAQKEEEEFGADADAKKKDVFDVVPLVRVASNATASSSSSAAAGPAPLNLAAAAFAAFDEAYKVLSICYGSTHPIAKVAKLAREPFESAAPKGAFADADAAPALAASSSAASADAAPADAKKDKQRKKK